MLLLPPPPAPRGCSVPEGKILLNGQATKASNKRARPPPLPSLPSLLPLGVQIKYFLETDTVAVMEASASYLMEANN